MGFGRTGMGMLILAAMGIWGLCRIGFGGSVGQEYVPVEIRYGKRSVRLTALRDTGNALRDPMTGEQVLVIGAEVAGKLCDLSREQLLHPMETMLKYQGFRLIPFHTVGQAGGMLLAMRFSDVTVGNRRGSAIVAFAPEPIGRGDVYQALTGGAI